MSPKGIRYIGDIFGSKYNIIAHPYNEEFERKDLNRNSEWKGPLPVEEISSTVGHKGQMYVSSSITDILPSERAERMAFYKQKHKVERPNPLRTKIVDEYIKDVLKLNSADTAVYLDIMRDMYQNRMDNRVLNNLR